MKLQQALLLVVCLTTAAGGSGKAEDHSACGCGAGGRLQSHVSITYPADLNSAVLGLGAAGEDAIAGEGLRTYRIEVVNGPAPVSGELKWWVEPQTEDVNLVQTNPQMEAQKPSLVSQWVTFAPCSSRVYVQNVWLVSTMADLPFRARAAFSWRWGSYTQEITTHAGGVPLRLGAVRSGWGTRRPSEEWERLVPGGLDSAAKGDGNGCNETSMSGSGSAGPYKSANEDRGDVKAGETVEKEVEEGADATQRCTDTVVSWHDNRGHASGVSSTSCPEGMTLVSAALNLMHTWPAPQRHWSAYVEGVAMLLALKCPLIVFIDASKIPLLQDAMHPKARLIPFDIDDMHAAAATAFGESFRESLKAMRSDEWKARRWNWDKIAESEEYLTLVLLKPCLFARAADVSDADEGPKNGDGLLVWVDAVKDCLVLLKPPLSLDGLLSRLARHQPDTAHNEERDAGSRKPRQIFATAYAGIGTVCRGGDADVDGLPCRLLPGFSIKASFFAATHDAARWLAGEYTRVLVRALSQGYLLTEEYYLAILVRELPERFALMDRSDNPMFEDDHCLPHSLLLPPESLPAIHIQWPPSGAAITPEEAVIVFDVAAGRVAHHGLLADDDTSMFVVGVRDLGEHEDAYGTSGRWVQGWKEMEGGAGGLAVGEIKLEGLSVAMTRAHHLQVEDLEAGVGYQVQVYRRSFPLSTRSGKITFTVAARPSSAIASADPSLVVDSRGDILDLISSLAILQPLAPRERSGMQDDRAAGACVVVASEMERLSSGSDVASVCSAQGLRVFYYLTRKANGGPPPHVGAPKPSDVDSAYSSVEWWDWMAPVDSVLVVSLDGVGMTAEDVTAEVSVWFDSLRTGGLIVGTGLFDGLFWDPCCCQSRQSHVASGVEMWARLAEVRVGCSLERGFPSWYAPKD